MTTKKPTDSDKITYIMTLKNGDTRKVTVPKAWKVTFGSLVPYTQGKGYPVGGAERPYGVRFYEGSEKNLRAVFSDVIALRDDSIEIQERRTTTKRQAVQKQGKNGMRDVMVEARVSEWVNPDTEEADEIEDEFLRLPGDDDE